MLLLAAPSLSGCAIVTATKRATLSRRCVQFQDDGDELVLENHLIDSREGSSGARGARGGGMRATFYPESQTTLEGGWRPMEVTRLALKSLLAVLQFLGSVAIFVIVFAPLWAPVWIFRRRRALR